MLRSSEESRSGASENPWNDTTVAQMLDRITAERPAETALVDGDRAVTFAEFQATRDRTAIALAGKGIGDGTHVAVLMTKGHDYAVLLHALWKIGAVAVPLNAMWTGREVERALSATAVELLIVDTTSATTDWKSITSHLELPTDGEIENGLISTLRRVVDWSAHTALVSAAAAIGTDESAPDITSSRQESLFLFTSGSSSAPKAVILRQDGLLGTAHFFAESLQMDSSDKYLSLGPFFHAGGIVQMLVANQKGAPVYVFPRVDIPTIAAVAVESGCTIVSGFDPVLVKLFDAITNAGNELPFRSVAASPAVEVVDLLRSHAIPLVTMYAMSEGGNMITLSTPGHVTFSHGRALPGLSVRVADLDGQPVGVGVEGEICFKGWNLFRGYYNVDGLPDERTTDSEHYFHTGDIGKIDEEGRLHYLGRFSSMIKTAGENVSATEVETFLVRELPEVATAAVLGVPSTAWGEAVVAFVELVPGAAPFDEARLKAACRGKLAGYKIPKQFVQVHPEGWPVSDTGKLSRVTLVEGYLSEHRVGRP